MTSTMAATCRGFMTTCTLTARSQMLSTGIQLIQRPSLTSRSWIQAHQTAPAICKRLKSTTSTSTNNDVQVENGVMEKKVEENLKLMKEGNFDFTKHPEKLEHFRSTQEQPAKEDGKKLDEEVPPIGSISLPHPIWTQEELQSVQVTHKNPKGISDKLAYAAVKTLRFSFDLMSGYRWKRNEAIWLTRISFLETVAGVPGMVAAMVRHLHSLRRMRRDHGWIHTLLEEAENERMHLMTALQLKQPSFLFKCGVVATQGVFVGGFSLAYLLSPKFCHRFVGYLEEEAVVTYSKLLKDMEPGGVMDHWNKMAAPDIAINYWQLQKTATMRDVVLAIRADEAHHRVVNHTLASMKPDDYNPYKPGE